MDPALPQKFPFILDRNLAKANCTGNHVCTFCDIAVIDTYVSLYIYKENYEKDEWILFPYHNWIDWKRSRPINQTAKSLLS